MSAATPIFFRASVLGGALCLVLLFFVAAPTASSTVSEDSLELPTSTEPPSPDILAQPPAAPPAPRAGKTLDLHLGPSDAYAVIGVVPRSARLDVVGKSVDGEWLAVAVPAGSKLHTWLKRSDVVDAPEVSALPVVPVRSLPAR